MYPNTTDVSLFPIAAALEGQPSATHEVRYRAGHLASHCLCCKGSRDSGLMRLKGGDSWEDGFSTKLITIRKTLYEALIDKQLELAQTAS